MRDDSSLSVISMPRAGIVVLGRRRNLWNLHGFIGRFSASHRNEELTRTWYDDYNWVTSPPPGMPTPFAASDADFNPLHNSHLLAASNTSFPYAQQPAKDPRTKGMATGARVKKLGTADFIYTLTIYDDKGRPVQVKTYNHTGGLDIATTQYSWSGQPLVMVSTQNKAGGGTGTSITTVAKNTYDALGRLVQTTSNVTDNATSVSSGDVVTAQNFYDELGQLKTKKLGVNGSAAAETQSYDYNIRGWLLGMNRDYVNNTQGTSKFGFDLAYDKPANLNNLPAYQAGQYNGNIAGMTWRGKQNGADTRRYDFNYDAANRILKADFKALSGTVANGTFNSQMGDGQNPETAYDYNGNILAMTQQGLYNSASQTIDQLAYTYIPGSNRLASVTDAGVSTTGLGDFNNGSNSGDDYDYDSNGNLTQDYNKNITDIQYNFLNLPEQITVAGKGTISYSYDAAGNKLSKTVNETGQPQKVTTYLGGMIFET